MIACPSCGRTIEGGDTCPHCGASLTQRLPVQWLRYGALVVAVAGLIALFIGARGAGTPHLPIGSLGAAQNLAYVEISGRVSAPVKYSSESHTLSFRVDDGTGEMLVSVFRAEAEALMAAGRVPAVGDRVTLAGTLRVRDDFASLTLNLPEALTLERPAPSPLVIGAIYSGLALTPVDITGRIVATREPYAGLTVLTLQDATGQIEVVLDESTRALTGEPAPFAPNDVVRISGVVTLFRDDPQITLISSRAIDVLPPGTPLRAPVPPAGAVVPIADVRAGTIAIVEGTATAVSSYSGGYRFSLADATGTLTLVLRERVYRDIAGLAALRLGAVVRASGPTEFFDGELEIVPDEAQAVTLLAPAPPTGPTTPISALSLASVGQTATLTGVITAVDDFDESKRLTVDDGTGTMTILLWSSVQAFVPSSDALSVGRSVRVTGVVDQYQDALELVPQIGFDVEIQ